MKLNKERSSWDAEWAERQNIPEWPMWAVIFTAAFVVFVIMKVLEAWLK